MHHHQVLSERQGHARGDGRVLRTPVRVSEQLNANFFTDDNGHLLEAEINAFRAAGVTTGCTIDDVYCPNAPVTREQMAGFFARALGLHTFKTVLFTDVTSGFFHGEINAIRGVGITLGCTATTYCPTGTLTRGEMAAFLARAHQLGVKRAPAVDITVPANLATFITTFDGGSYVAFVTFGASAIDPNGGTPTLAWKSSVQGPLGVGPAIIVDLVIPLGADNSQPVIVVRATDSRRSVHRGQVQVKLVLPSP